MSLPLILLATLLLPPPAGETGLDRALGVWDMATEYGGGSMPAVLTLKKKGDGLGGTWVSQGQTMELTDLVVDGDSIRFKRSMGQGGALLAFDGSIDGDTIRGRFTGTLGEMACSGTREGAAVAGDSDSPAGKKSTGEKAGATLRGRPIVNDNGKTLVWAHDDDGSGQTDYFDFTDANIDPGRMDHGIGRDRIPAIDNPVFVAADDPRLDEAGIRDDTMVLGVELEGIARAYPVATMSRHEIVNDEFDGHPFAVLW